MKTLEFPQMGTIMQAHEKSGVPVYRIRQLCKSGTVRSVQCGRKTLVNLTSLCEWMQGDSGAKEESGIYRERE